MIKSLFGALALVTLTATSSLAELVKLSEDMYLAEDARGNVHRIQYVRMDHEGDVQIKVQLGNEVGYFWFNCRDDRYSRGGDAFNGWHYVDHRNMVGYYSDVACGRK